MLCYEYNSMIPFFFFWASCSNHCLAALDLGAGVEQPFGCLIIQNSQTMQYMGRSMDWTLEDNMVDGLFFCATLTGRRMISWKRARARFSFLKQKNIPKAGIVSNMESIGKYKLMIKVIIFFHEACANELWTTHSCNNHKLGWSWTVKTTSWLRNGILFNLLTLLQRWITCIIGNTRKLEIKLISFRWCCRFQTKSLRIFSHVLFSIACFSVGISVGTTVFLK